MYYILFSTVLAFLITYFSIPIIIKIAKVKHLFDEPDERKVHKEVIPTLGGMGIFSGFVVAVLMGIPPGTNPEIQYIIAASLTLFFLGLKDDILDISASKKFMFQLLAAAVVVRFGGIYLQNLNGFLDINEIPYLASFIFSIFTIIVITNAMNLIDGVDGLAGTVAFISSIVFGVYFLLSGFTSYAVMAFSLAGAIFGFLIFNFSPAKIFMGDTGSMLLGLMASVFVIKFINIASSPDAVIPMRSAAAVGFSILLIPLLDTLRVFTLRILDRRSPFSADRLHLHHYLLDIGHSHRQIAIYIGLFGLLFPAISYLLRDQNIHLVFGVLFAVAFSGVGLVYLKRKKVLEAKAREEAELESNDYVTTHKLVTFPLDKANIK